MHKDQDIIELLADPSQHEKAFRMIVTSYKERLYHVIRKILIDHDDTDDVLQDAFIKIWKNLDKFRGDANLYTWLYRIGTNEALSYLRKRKNTQNISMDDNPELMSMLESASKGSQMTGDEISLRLQRAVLELPEKQRLVFNMKYFDKLKYEEIAEITETSVGGLKANYHMAVKKIEEILTEK
jgi:RNA polymerase sigma-70 factor (ECF subfamily)